MTSDLPVLRPDALNHADLAHLCREYLLAGHLIDRAAMGHIIGTHGAGAVADVAIDEWMGASPVYTARTQRALGFGGDDVETMFKGMQIDIGAPPEFLDFRFVVHDATHGEFTLAHCGALMDVEPIGEEMVHTMCHTIEAPTFEATACASNPRARLAAVHRPPRVPADRMPHCHWTVEIRDDVEAWELPAAARALEQCRAATIDLARWGLSDDGRGDYAGPLDADLRMEDFSTDALSAIAGEATMQSHLLVASFWRAIEARYGAEHAVDLVTRQFRGVAGAVARRLQRWFGFEASPDGFASLLAMHPGLGPDRYTGWSVEVVGGSAVVTQRWAPATDAGEPRTWATLPADSITSALDAMVGEIDRRARCVPLVDDGGTDGAIARWRVELGDEPRRRHDDVLMTLFSTGADFRFERVGQRTAARPAPEGS
ncbi:MAG TPA: hypothetical protein PKA24_16945 [Microthrixaceae bacterium]|nr:hypothetical protein [Microthrixaceae bacterium]